MEAYICDPNRVLFSSAFPSYKTKLAVNVHQSLHFNKLQEEKKPCKKLHGYGFQVRCVKLDSGAVAELGEAAEMEEEWMNELGKWKERCTERKGMVELLEYLEKEAIMGDDEGRDPVDYNRRALIFDKSSKVFQALKQRTPPSHHSCS